MVYLIYVCIHNKPRFDYRSIHPRINSMQMDIQDNDEIQIEIFLKRNKNQLNNQRRILNHLVEENF